MENISERFAEHLFSASHWNRQQSLRENRLDENKRVPGQTSSFIVSPFFQISQKKKVTWKWSDVRRAFEFVYAQLGLADIRERRNFKSKRDLYCSLCAESFKAAKYELEHHIRSFSHIFYYVHNHRPQAIPELETILLNKEDNEPTKHKNIRRLFAKTLKDLEKEKGEIKIYDMSIKFCEMAEVKDAIAVEGYDQITPVDLLKHNGRSAPSDGVSTAIYANDFERKAPAEVQQFLVYLMNSSIISETRNELTLETAKRKILTASVSEEPTVASIALPPPGGEDASVAVISVDSDSSSSVVNGDKTGAASVDRVANADADRSPGSRSPPVKSPSPERPISPARRDSMPTTFNRFNTIIQRIFPSSRQDIYDSRKPTEIRNVVSPSLNAGRGGARRSPTPVLHVGDRRPSSPSESGGVRAKHHHSRHHRRSRSRSSSLQRHRQQHPPHRRSRSPHYRFGHRERDRDGRSSRWRSRSKSRSESGRADRANSKTTDQKAESIIASSAANKIQMKIPSQLGTKPPTSPMHGYRIRNAPADPSAINYDKLDPVDPHAEDRDDLKKPALKTAKMDTLSKSTTNPYLTKALDAAHAKAVEEFLSKNGASLGGADLLATSSTTAAAVAASLVNTTNSGMRPPNFFGGQPPPGMPPFFPPPFNFGTAGVPFGMMRPPFLGAPPPIFPGRAPPGGVAAFPPLGPPHGALPPPPQISMNHMELILRAKMELYQRDLVNIRSVAELIEYMWNQGYEKIPLDEPPLLFNIVVGKRRAILGCNTLYQIQCYEHPELETYYCGMCNYWTTVSEMFMHLCAPMHRLNYMFRNYKVYHKRAMEEKEENVRDLLLEKMAEQIWELEGSGKCTHRMRCFLNEDAIRRLWPEYVNCIDNSWKVVDMDLELDTPTPAQRESKNGTKSASARAPTSNEGGAGDAEVEGDGAISDLLRQYRAEMAEHTHKDQINAQLDAIESMKEDEKGGGSKHSSRIEKKKSDKEHRSGGRSSPSSKKRKERSHSRSPVRGRHHASRSPSSTTTGGKSSAKHDRHRRSSDRRHSPSATTTATATASSSSSSNKINSTKDDRKRRRSRSRERAKESGKKTSGISPSLGEHAKKKLDSWDAKAAAFLDRIGNRRDATRLYLSAALGAENKNDDGAAGSGGGLAAFLPKDGAELSSTVACVSVTASAFNSTSASTSSASRSNKTDRVPQGVPPPPLGIPQAATAKSLDDRLRSASSGIISSSARGDSRGEMELELAKLHSAAVETTPRRPPSRNNGGGGLGGVAVRPKPADEKADMRKTIGVIVELQSIFETEKFISGETIFKVCEDMGIAAKDAVINSLLRETASMYGVDMATAYEQWVTRKLVEAQQQEHLRREEQELQQRQSIFSADGNADSGGSRLVGLSSELMDILRKVNMNQQQQSQNAFLEQQRQPSTSTPASDFGEQMFSRRQYEPELNTDMNFVYSGADDIENEASADDDDGGGRNSASNQGGSGGGKRTSRDPNEIESTISRLTYAFGTGAKKNQPPPPKSVPLNAAAQQQQLRFANAESFLQNSSKNDSEEEETDAVEERAAISEESGLEQQRQFLQGLAEANGLRPEIAAAAAAAAIEQQREQLRAARQKRKNAGRKERAARAKEKVKEITPNANLEPLGNVRAFGSGVFEESGKSGRRAGELMASMTSGDGKAPAVPTASGTKTGGGQTNSQQRANVGGSAAVDVSENFDVSRVARSFVNDEFNEFSGSGFLRFGPNGHMSNSGPGAAQNRFATPRFDNNIGSGRSPTVAAAPNFGAIRRNIPPIDVPTATTYSTAAQRIPLTTIQQQRQQQQLGGAAVADSAPVYQRNAPPQSMMAGGPRGGAKQPLPPPRPNGGPAAGGSNLNSNLLNMASQIGDDWGSLNNYLSNLLKPGGNGGKK